MQICDVAVHVPALISTLDLVSYIVLVTLVEVEVDGEILDGVALLEQLHDLQVFGIVELPLEFVQLFALCKYFLLARRTDY